MQQHTSEITELGKSILSMHYHNSQPTEHDDLYHAQGARLVVAGIDAYLRARNLPEEKRARIIQDLKDFAEESFLEHCLRASMEIGITHDEEEDRRWFSCLYENGDYPE